MQPSSSGLRRWGRLAAASGVVALLAAACAPPPVVRWPGAVEPRLPATIRIGEPGRGPSGVRRVPIEHYVLASILAEVAPADLRPDAAERLFEVQAVVARTYAAANLGRHAPEGFDLCTTTHCQVADFQHLRASRWRAVAERAVARTAGLVLLYREYPATTVFHADCGGHTSAASDVWGGPPLPYLAARRDDPPGRPAHQTWRFEVRRRELRTLLNADPRTAVGSRGPTLRILRRDAAGRVIELEARGTREVRLRGEEFRSHLVRTLGARSLRSAWFTVKERGEALVFEGRGFGHGVGLCQLGARARIEAGLAPADALKAYYPGTRLAAARLQAEPTSLALLPSRLGLP